MLMAVWVGIDIAAKDFALVSRSDGKSSRAMKFKQTAQGHQQAAKHLKKLNPSGVVMEATGVYYLDLAVALAHAGLPVMVLNPKSFHHFAKLKLSPSKTDGIDADLLAEYGERMTPVRWVPPDETRLGLRDIGRQINRLTASRTQAKNRLHALQAKSMTLPLLLEDEQEGITLLDHRIERLQKAALTLIEHSPELAQQLQHFTAAVGVGVASAIVLLGELCVLPREMKAAQVSRHAGLDVQLGLSGSSVHRPARLSKAGNAYLRAAMYMPAMSAIGHDPRAQAFYQSLVARGKKKIQALCAVMRKYLTGLWACLRAGTPFDSTKLFSECQARSA
jgi:transposase